jgi:hypothetical protein
MSEAATERARAAEARRREREQRIQRQLDEALAASFPASDPVSIVTSHAEEDWGMDPAEPEAPTPPAEPAQRGVG